MTQKTLGYTELEWTCPKCKTRNPGTARACTGCGAAQPEDVQFEQAGRHAERMVTDQAKIEAAKKGADIHCPYCKARNPAGTEVCIQCGGDLKEGVRRESGKVVGAYQAPSGPVKEIACPSCGAPNPETGKVCIKCGARLDAPAPPAAPAAITAGRKPNRTMIILAATAAVILVVACLAFLIAKMTQRQDLTASVEGVHWMRLVPILALVDVQRQAFIDEIPADVTVGQCELRYHHTQDTPAENSKEVCGTPYTKDTGSGLGEVVQDCQYEVYVDYCAYTAQELQAVDQAALQGEDLSPLWPQVSLGQGQQEGQRQQEFIVYFLTDQGKTIEYHPADEAAFRQFTPGSDWVLVLNGFGDVVSVEAK
jgi:hypothetical protein